MPRSNGRVVRVLLAGLLVAEAFGNRAYADDVRSEAFFENRVRPILAGTCFRCHGGQKVSGGLRIDARP